MNLYGLASFSVNQFHQEKNNSNTGLTLKLWNEILFHNK